MIKAVLLLAVAAVTVAQKECDGGNVIKSAIVYLEGNGITGNITFTSQDNGKVHLTGRIVGMAPGMYGFHVHESGDLTGGCGSAKAHFNPDGHHHGHPDDEVRHAGDLGNIKFDESRTANIDIEDRLLALNGRYSIVGRSVVLHSQQDDYGRSDHPDSKKTGNAGGRVACGVIGILEATSDASTAAVNLLLIAATAISVFIHLN